MARPCSEHIAWNGREYFRDGGLWVVAFREQHESDDLLERPAKF